MNILHHINVLSHRDRCGSPKPQIILDVRGSLDDIRSGVDVDTIGLHKCYAMTLMLAYSVTVLTRVPHGAGKEAGTIQGSFYSN